MLLLERKINSEGKVLPGDILNVGSFLNQMLDVQLLREMGNEFHRLFSDCAVNKILTIESSGISIACMTALCFGCRVAVAKKGNAKNVSGDVYTAKEYSYTRDCMCDVTVPKQYLNKNDKILIIDDFLAKGSALDAMISIANQAGAQIVGAGIAVEKAYQGGGDAIRARGIRVESLARIASMSVDEGVVFCV